MTSRREGFTIVEVLIAVIMLTIGILGLASTTGGITRMMSNGQRKTRSYAKAASIMDSLRNEAKRSCGSLANGSGTSAPDITVSWRISNAGSTNATHVIEIRTSYMVGGRAKGDTLIATVRC